VVLLDAFENLWLGTRHGIHQVELDVMQEQVLGIRAYGPEDGFIGLESLHNAAFLDADSSLWFGTVRGAIRYDQREVVEDPREPLVHLTDMQLFYERPDWSPWCAGLGRNGFPRELELPHNKNHLTFAFTGISLAYPEKVRYRWILEGYDPDWSPITATQRVTYSNIPPGTYTFKVMARNASGIWNEAPVTYPFTIAPPFWQTNTFRVGGGAALLLGLFGFVRIRERSLHKDRERLEATVARRTAELASAKDRSDELLLNILPASTAEELKRKGSADARRYESCTVLFSDFKGFTGFSSLMDSDTLVSELDHYFRLFDTLTDTYGIEKIKTIGDAYMCASGLPEPTKTHALNAVLMGLGMIEAVERSNLDRARKGLTEWPVRVGIHTGPVVAGVVGEKKFAYDIWGDTVNLASRMESHGEAGRVNISGVTYAQLMDYVDVVPRGPIKVKGKGELHMYFVLRLKPEYSADEAGRLPNARLLAVRN
jgi:class 3 adenylate cyclase